MAGDNFQFTVYGQKDFISYGQIFVNKHARFGLTLGAKIIFKPDSITRVGSYHIGHFSKNNPFRIGEIECHGCNFITIQAEDSTLRTHSLLLKITHHQQLPDTLIGHRKLLYNAYKERKGLGTNIHHHYDYVDVYAYQENHEAHGPAIMRHTGNVIMDVGHITLDASEFSSEKKIEIVSYPIINVIGRSAKQHLEIDTGKVTWRNPIENVINTFGLKEVTVERSYSKFHIYRYYDSFNSILYAKEGITGNAASIRVQGVSDANQHTLLGEGAKHGSIISTISAKEFLPDNRNSISDKSIELYDFESKTTMVATITADYLKEKRV